MTIRVAGIWSIDYYRPPGRERSISLDRACQGEPIIYTDVARRLAVDETEKNGVLQQWRN
jgi:hypothetical protein